MTNVLPRRKRKTHARVQHMPTQQHPTNECNEGRNSEEQHGEGHPCEKVSLGANAELRRERKHVGTFGKNGFIANNTLNFR